MEEIPKITGLAILLECALLMAEIELDTRVGCRYSHSFHPHIQARRANSPIK